MESKGEPSTNSSGSTDKNKERKERLNKLHLLRTAGNFIIFRQIRPNTNPNAIF